MTDNSKVGPKRYQRLFFRFMDDYATRNNLRGDHMITEEELRTMFDAVCERIRTGYHLGDGEHKGYSDMMRIIFYGKDKGKPDAH